METKPFDFTLCEGFIFDCDGTLLDTLGAWDAAEAELFAEAGPMTREQEDEIHSAPIEVAAQILHERYGVKSSTQEVLDHLDGYLKSYYGYKAKALPGASEFVNYLYALRIPCVVVSSSPRRYLEAGFARTGMLDCFDALITTDETGFSKQDYEIYDLAVTALDKHIEDVWCIDDAPYAIKVMSEYGLHTIGVNGEDSEEKRRLFAPYANLVIGNMFDLL